MAGFIYIMSNPSLSAGLYKIGKSDRDPEEFRRVELSTTSVPDAFRVEYFAYIENHHEMEMNIHNAFRSNRHNEKREFFYVSVPEVIAFIRNTSVIRYEKIDYKSPEEILIEEQKFLRQKEEKIKKQLDNKYKKTMNDLKKRIDEENKGS